jgi:hypothetical protein
VKAEKNKYILRLLTRKEEKSCERGNETTGFITGGGGQFF